ncbi:MAG: 16S rRNA (guanine(527)-N(7))-methyltransferase RsmG, partial [Parasporobacterium sp.]|nr:16S rRNA (guanine(527)-N(7))-methyltransferase RsmG [Parasporobacterium sp.]
ITEFEDIVEKHFIDSCINSDLWIDPILIRNTSEQVSVPENLQNKKCRLIDIGTGAGFPGIPLKILYPDLKLTLMDSLNKRIIFLKELINGIDLHDVDIIHSRAEDGARNIELREKFDFVVSRAVANMSTLSEYCLPFVKMDGIFCAYKSNVDEEIHMADKAISVLGGKIEKIINSDLPLSKSKRNIIIIRKVRSTGKQYPRKAGVPSKNPIV